MLKLYTTALKERNKGVKITMYKQDTEVRGIENVDKDSLFILRENTIKEHVWTLPGYCPIGLLQCSLILCS